MSEARTRRRRIKGIAALEIIGVLIVLVALIGATLARHAMQPGAPYADEARARLLADDGEVKRHAPDAGGIPDEWALVPDEETGYQWRARNGGVAVRFGEDGDKRTVHGRAHALTPALIDKRLIYKEEVR